MCITVNPVCTIALLTICYTFVQNYIKCADSEEMKENTCNNEDETPVETIRIKAKPVEEKTNTSIRSCAQQSYRKEQNTDHSNKKFCNRHMNFSNQCQCNQQNTVGKHSYDYLSNESHNKIPEIHTKTSITDDKKVSFKSPESKLPKPVLNSTEKSINLPSNCSVSTIGTDETTYRHIPENGMKKNNEDKQSLPKRDVKPRKPCGQLRKRIARIFKRFKNS